MSTHSENLDRRISNDLQEDPGIAAGKESRLISYALRKIWLPRVLYTLIPLFYIVAGSLALFGALMLPGWSWLLPYALLGAGICIHAAAIIMSMRLRNRRK